MDHMVKIGMIGYSEGNGHPFSFSSIINGFDYERLADSGWRVIADYLAKADPVEIGLPGARVTHAWNPDEAVSEALARSCHIETVCPNYTDMIGKVDAVVIARDDYASHLEIARPFLRRDIPVFIDKPLTVDLDELKEFRPFLESGLLFSTSGLRYARELDDVRVKLRSIGAVKAVSATVVLGWEKYGIHMLDVISSLFDEDAVAVTGHQFESSQCHLVEYPGFVAHIVNIGPSCKTFHLDIFAEKENVSVNIEDNFHAFKRTLQHFLKQAGERRSGGLASRTESVIRTLIAGNRSRQLRRRIELSEVL